MNEIIHIDNTLPQHSGGGDINDLINRFLAQSQIVEGSRRAYKTALRKYIGWIEEKGLNLKDITKVELLQFNDDLLKNKFSSLTINGYLVAIRNFYEYLESIKLYPNIAKDIKPNKVSTDHRKESLTEEQVHQLLEYMKTQPLRDYAIVAMIIGMALRSVEVVRLSIGDIVLKSGKRVALIWGKGRKEKDEDSVIIDELWEIVESYLKTRKNIKPEDALFVSESNNGMGKRLTTRAISRICKEALCGIGLNDKMYTCHSLRHTNAVLLLLAGVPLYEVQQVLRHKSPETTMVYLESIRKRKRLEDASVEKLGGLFGRKE